MQYRSIVLQSMQNNSEWQDYPCISAQVSARLKQNSLWSPTQIQCQMFRDYSHYQDFIMASQTGSGKTLAFLAPIVSQLPAIGALMVLIITPTRELAQQIEQVAHMLQAKVQAVVGGMSKQKQTRLLRQNPPQIIVGTPGRLFQLLEDQVLDFTSLKYLVMDEADRMVEFGHFKEVDKILQAIFKKQQLPVQQEHMDGEKGEYFIRQGKKKIKLKLDIDSIATEQIFEVPAEIVEQFQIRTLNQVLVKEKKKKQFVPYKLTEEESAVLSKMKRKVFFISATLTHEFNNSKYFYKKNPIHQEKQQSEYIPKLKALISRVQLSGKPKIIDLSATFFLPLTLTERVTFVQDQFERICVLINYLKGQPATSKTLIFTNTIRVSKRVSFFVQSFGFSPLNLHSHMQQKQRLKKLQRFNAQERRGILVATDVAARGLDLSVSHVVQIGNPISGDTYVHRVGRTARANAPGESLLILLRKEGDNWAQINDSLPSRQVLKYGGGAEFRQRVEELEWARVQNQRMKEKREPNSDQEVQPMLEEEVVNKHIIVRKIQQIKKNNTPKAVQKKMQWKKNKLVLSIQDIKRMM